jgi:glycosyltransferase involved in cell wall biosynthesis
MKILYVTDVFPPRCGGSGWSVYFFARALRRHGHDVSIISLDSTPRVYDGFEVRAFPIPKSGVPFFTNWRKEAVLLPRIGSEMQSMVNGFDVVHAHHKWSLIALASANPSSLFVTIRDYWPICFCGRSTFRTEEACSVYDFTRCSEQEHGAKGLLTPILYPWFESRMRKRRELLSRARRIFCISRHVREQLLPFFPPQQLAVLHNFSEPLDASAPADLPPRFLLYIGKLETNKGAHLLPQLLERSKLRLPLVVLGEGSLTGHLQRDFDRRGLKALFLGYLDYPEMLSVLKQAEFLLFPSVWAEPLGRVLIEAAMMGKPAIAFSSPGGHHDIIRNGESGILAESEDAFADAVGALGDDAELRQKMGEAARKVYEETFQPDIIISSLLKEYTS